MFIWILHYYTSILTKFHSSWIYSIAYSLVLHISGMLYLCVYKTCDLRSISLWLWKTPPSVESALVYKQDHVRREALYQGGFPIKEPHRSSSISKAGEKVSYTKLFWEVLQSLAAALELLSAAKTGGWSYYSLLVQDLLAGHLGLSAFGLTILSRYFR